jgi:hypothetical protein
MSIAGPSPNRLGINDAVVRQRLALKVWLPICRQFQQLIAIPNNIMKDVVNCDQEKELTMKKEIMKRTNNEKSALSCELGQINGGMR